MTTVELTSNSLKTGMDMLHLVVILWHFLMVGYRLLSILTMGMESFKMYHMREFLSMDLLL